MEPAIILMTLRLFLRLLLGLILLSVGISKLTHPRHFQHSIQDYQLLPRFLESRFALSSVLSFGIPVTELLAGLGLLSGLLLIPALLVSLCLFVIFSVAMFINLMRGRSDLSCHCNGLLGDHRISWWLIARNALLIVSLLILLLTPADQFTIDTFVHHPSLISTATWENAVLLAAFLVAGTLIIAVLSHVARDVLRSQ